MTHIAFVILHYKSIQYTENCIRSIFKLDGGRDCSIIVVDNGSCDGSGELLRDRFKKEEQVTVILNNENLGFAKGNNIGYDYAKKHCHADFIIVTNNDVLFEQKEFLEVVTGFFDSHKYHVLGPDVVTPVGIHQNPLRMHPYSVKQVRFSMMKKRILLHYLQLKKTLHLDDRVQILEKIIEPGVKKRHDAVKRDEIISDVVLQGACVIFSPLFVEKEKYAFAPET